MLMGVWAIAATVGSNLAHSVKLNIGRPYNTAIPQIHLLTYNADCSVVHGNGKLEAT